MSLADLSWSDMGRGAMILARMQFQADENRPKLPELLSAIRDAMKDADQAQSNSRSFSDPMLAAKGPGLRLAEEARRVTIDLYGEEYADDLFERITR